MMVDEPDIQDRKSTFMELLLGTLVDGGRHVKNQFITVPGLFGRPGDRSTVKTKYFGTSWCIMHRITLLLFATCSGAFYGGMHSLKWNYEFPSVVEKLMWRISAFISVTGIVPIVALALAVRWTRSRPVGCALCWALCTISGVVFLIARSFLIVESFVSVRALPEQAYDAVQWAEAIPHI